MTEDGRSDAGAYAPPAAGAGRLVAFGELLLRCSPPGRELLMQSPKMDVWVGGAEANVATQLARFGHKAAFISAVPDNALGDAALFALRGNGVDVDAVVRRPGRMGLYFVSSGTGARATDVLYDRIGTSFATAPAELWEWAELLRGAGRLHLSGVTPALSQQGTSAALAAADTAVRLNIPISFDGNYRARLWEAWDGQPGRTLPRLVEQAELLFGNHRDISLLLGTPFGGADPDARRTAALAAFDRFPKLTMIASTIRHVEDAGINRLAARIDMRDDAFETEEMSITAIVDRIGAGDAFAAGVLHGVQARMPIHEIAAFALTTSVLKHSLPGDASLFRLADVEHAMGTDLDVRR